MGGVNRHPSCCYTWRQTTLTSQKISDGVAKLMMANSRLEDVLLAEFSGANDPEAADEMAILLRQSSDDLLAAQGLLRLSLDTSQANPDDFAEARKNLNPEAVAERWNGTLLVNSVDDVCRIAREIKGDRLATAKRFITEIGRILALYTPAIEAFKAAREKARLGHLRQALEANEIPLQRTYGRLLSEVLRFMNEYLVDSLVATQVSFSQRQRPALVAA